MKIYKKFDSSDLLYKNGYTTTDITLSRISSDSFIVSNEKKYYVDNNTGMIFEEQTSTCDDLSLPFFFPLSMVNDNNIEVEICFNDIGLHHNTYVFKTIVSLNNIDDLYDEKFGEVFDCKYIEVSPPLQGVTYE